VKELRPPVDWGRQFLPGGQRVFWKAEKQHAGQQEQSECPDLCECGANLLRDGWRLLRCCVLASCMLLRR
jgi:hypothetical protein